MNETAPHLSYLGERIYEQSCIPPDASHTHTRAIVCPTIKIVLPSVYRFPPLVEEESTPQPLEASRIPIECALCIYRVYNMLSAFVVYNDH